MSFYEFSDRIGPWLEEDGPSRDVVLSSRLRLARNLAGFPFLSQSTWSQKESALSHCLDAFSQGEKLGKMSWYHLHEISSSDLSLFVERHLMSQQHAQRDFPRGLGLTEDESMSIMLNEEDHIRMQVLYSGFQLENAWEAANKIDDEIEAMMSYAYSPSLGYLTACPTNVGTGLRVSVMMHLPALGMTGEINKLKHAARDLHLAVRGYHGEGSRSLGDFYQVSNQTTLGKTEGEIIADFKDAVIPAIIDYEKHTRAKLREHKRSLYEDRVYRSMGVLMNSRLIGTEEAIGLLSYLRLGVVMGDLSGITMHTLNELFVLIQPAHLQRLADQKLDDIQEREFRASLIRMKLSH